MSVATRQCYPQAVHPNSNKMSHHCCHCTVCTTITPSMSQPTSLCADNLFLPFECQHHLPLGIAARLDTQRCASAWKAGLAILGTWNSCLPTVCICHHATGAGGYHSSQLLNGGLVSLVVIGLEGCNGCNKGLSVFLLSTTWRKQQGG